MRRALSIAVHEPVRVLIFGAGASVPLMLSSWRCAFGLEALRHKERAHSWLPSLASAGFTRRRRSTDPEAALALLHAVVDIEGQRREQIFDDPALAGENLGVHRHAGQQRRGTAVDVE